MAVLVGIDEAGFGPILGPLVVSSAAFRVPNSLLAADLWKVLRRSVSSKRRHLVGRLLIADSKVAHNKSQGVKNLERTVLACLRCLDKQPTTLSQLIELLCPDCLQRLANYPWYEDLLPQIALANDQDKAIASCALADDMAANGVELLELRSCCLDVAFYNQMVNTVKNKARVLFTTTSQLIQHACDTAHDEDVQIIVDRQGGRVRYRKSLLRMFPYVELRILRESPHSSSYELTCESKVMRLHFVVDADERFLPVSLASMASKYVRELLVRCINRYFAGFHADLRPTAGYWKDGLRFINDLKQHIPNVTYDSTQLIRCR
jgi:ribonuclease HII